MVSLAKTDKVDLFLEKNPRAPRELLLLDTGLTVYGQVSFCQIAQDSIEP